MRGFKEPGFNDRVAAANSAKTRALEMLKNRPKLSKEELAERADRQRAKEAVQAAKRAAAEAALEAERDAKDQAEREAAEATAEATEAARVAAEAARPKLPSDVEMKAARDARYAARKARKR